MAGAQMRTFRSLGGGVKPRLWRKLGKCPRCMRVCALGAVTTWIATVFFMAVLPSSGLMVVWLVPAIALTILLFAHVIALTARLAVVWQAVHLEDVHGSEGSWSSRRIFLRGLTGAAVAVFVPPLFARSAAAAQIVDSPTLLSPRASPDNDPWHPVKELITDCEAYREWAKHLKKALEAYKAKLEKELDRGRQIKDQLDVVNGALGILEEDCAEYNLQILKDGLDSFLARINLNRLAADAAVTGFEFYAFVLKLMLTSIVSGGLKSPWELIEKALDFIIKLLKAVDQSKSDEVKKLKDRLKLLIELLEHLMKLLKLLEDVKKSKEAREEALKEVKEALEKALEAFKELMKP
jgi:hypothetical protein